RQRLGPSQRGHGILFRPLRGDGFKGLNTLGTGRELCGMGGGGRGITGCPFRKDRRGEIQTVPKARRDALHKSESSLWILFSEWPDDILDGFIAQLTRWKL